MTKKGCFAVKKSLAVSYMLCAQCCYHDHELNSFHKLKPNWNIY